ncbi:hypothetical protein V8F33_010050 [Rhypophila sp. PSN 637]
MSHAIESERPSIPVLEQHAFTYSDGSFTCMGLCRMTEDELRELTMEPNADTVTAEARSIWEGNINKIVTTQFLEAQLQFYGENYYPYPAMRRVSLNMLRQAVVAGKCHQVPERIRKIEAEMRNKYEPLLEKYQSDLGVWELSKAQQEAAPGLSTEMALDEARCDSPDTEMKMEVVSQVSEEPANNQVATHIPPSNNNSTLPVVERSRFTYTNGQFTSNGVGPGQ